jgi:hypothetical protein
LEETPARNAIVGVYRRRNVGCVLRLLEPALRAQWLTAWWALDGADPKLADYTIGEGPGEKLLLVNRALAKLPPATWTVISDDDLVFQDSNVVEFVMTCDALQLDLAQPARVRGTQRAHAIVEQRRRSRARLTSFVECGPLYAVGPRYRDRILPLPEQRGMGWGLEIDWFDLHRGGCRLGIIDELPMEHVGVPVADYDYREMNQKMKAELVARGNPRWKGMQETLAVWRPWQADAPWLRDRGY